MASSFTIKHLCFSLALLIIATSCCKAQAQQSQDAVQIVAKAALCFDNRTIIMNCITTAQSMANATNNSTFCQGPCYGQAMLLMNCMSGIFSNYQFYSPAMMTGMKSVFQVACGKNATDIASDDLLGTNHGDELSIPMDMVAYLPVLIASLFVL